MASNNLDRYIEFMNNEAYLANREKQDFSSIEEVKQLVSFLDVNDISSLKEYINKHISVLFDYAPHLTMQVFLTCYASDTITALELPDRFNELLSKENLPNKAKPIINSYLSLFKEKEVNPPSENIASDEKILDAIKDISPKQIQMIVIMIQVRLTLGVELNYFIDLLSPYFEDKSKDASLKLTLLVQLIALSLKYPASRPLIVNLAKNSYKIVLDGHLELSNLPFNRGLAYYLDSVKVSSQLKELIISWGLMILALYYSSDEILSTGDDVKAFATGCIDIFNKTSIYYAPKMYYPIQVPEEYKLTKGYQKARELLENLTNLAHR